MLANISFKTSRFLLFIFFICCQAPFARCQEAIASNHFHQLKFISGMEMDAHYKIEITGNFTEMPKGNDEATPVSNNTSLKKENTTEANDAALAALNDNDPAEGKEGGAAAPVQIVMPKTSGKANNVLTSVTPYDEEVDPVINKYAEMINTDPHDIDNYPLYKFIDAWYGTRYKWGGNDNTGIDCSAFSQKLYGKVYGIGLLRTARQQHRKCERVKDYNEADEGDLVFFRIHHLGISHVGIYLTNGYFVHASRSQGVVISNLNNRYWRRRYASCGKMEKGEAAPMESDYQ